MAKEKEPIRIWPADEAEQIATETLIPSYHPHLLDARILFLFTNQEKKSKGKIVYAFTTKLSGPTKYLSSGAVQDIDEGYDFQILISDECWGRFTHKQRVALVDHELCHCIGEETDDGWKWSMIAHDVEEFRDVVIRHGLWDYGLQQIAIPMAEQLRMPIFPDGTAAPPGSFKEQVGEFLQDIKPDGVTIETDSPIGAR